MTWKVSFDTSEVLANPDLFSKFSTRKYVNKCAWISATITDRRTKCRTVELKLCLRSVKNYTYIRNWCMQARKLRLLVSSHSSVENVELNHYMSLAHKSSSVRVRESGQSWWLRVSPWPMRTGPIKSLEKVRQNRWQGLFHCSNVTEKAVHWLSRKILNWIRLIVIALSLHRPVEMLKGGGGVDGKTLEL